MKKLSLAAIAALGLGACGGGNDPSGANLVVPPAKTAAGVVGGTPTALTFGGLPASISGSVTENGKPASANDVQPGDVIQARVVASSAKADGGVQLSEVAVRFEVKGALSRVDVAAGLLELYSQTVLVDALTRIYEDNPDDSYTSLTLADLSVGDYVEVSGQRQADGQVVATRVERKLLQAGDAGYSEVELRGPVSGLDTVAKSFLIDGQGVDYGSATLSGSLANGVRAEVEGSLSGSRLVARKVEVESRASGERSGEGELEAQLSGLDTTARRFNLLGYVVDYSQASLSGTLVEGARVEVEGRFDANDANLLRASKVEVKHRNAGSGAADGEVKGALAAVDAMARTFEVGSAGYYADDSTVIERDDRAVSFDQLQNGGFVEVKFDSTRQVSGRSYAVKVELKSGSGGGGSGSSGGQELKGEISGFDAGAKSFVLNGTAVQVNASTRYEEGDQASSEATFFGADRNGQRCEVKGSLNGAVLLAGKIELESE